MSPPLTTDYVIITSASKELSPVAEIFSERIRKEIKNISEKLNKKVNYNLINNNN